MKNEKKMEKKNDMVSVNLLPISIMLAAIIISGTILFSQNKDTDNSTPDSTSTEETAGVGDTQFPAVETTIDDDPYLGDKDTATVAIVEFSEYQCGYCGKHTDETLPEIITNFIDTGKAIYVFRDFQMYGEVSESIAKIGECVFDESGIDKFLDYHTRAFALTTVEPALQIVTELGLNSDKIQTCSEKSDRADDLIKDMEDGQAVGIEGTPGFVVGKLDSDGNVVGKLIAGAYPYSDFASIINEYLE